MTTLKLQYWLALPRKFDRLALLQAARGLWGRSPRVGSGTRTATKHALAGSSSTTTPDRRGRAGASILATPFRFFARLFFSDFELQREGKTLNVKLATKVPEVGQPAPVDKAMAEALPLHVALKALLDSHAKTRRVMRHLAFFEGGAGHSWPEGHRRGASKF